MEAEDIVYRIDRCDRLTYVSPSWDAFAAANGGGAAAAGKVQGRTLWDFINDAETRHLHRVLVKRVREGRIIEGLPFRCDSPAQRRYMTMDLRPLDNKGVEYRSRLLQVEPREAMPPQRSSLPSEELLRMCSWCQRVSDDNGEWREIEQVVGIFEWFDEDHRLQITHGLCDRCLYGLLHSHQRGANS